MAGEPEVTLGEIGRRIDALSISVERLTTHMEVTYVRRDVYEQSQKLSADRLTSQDDRIETLEGQRDRLVWTIVGFVLLAILGAAFAYVKTAPGVGG